MLSTSASTQLDKFHPMPSTPPSTQPDNLNTKPSNTPSTQNDNIYPMPTIPPSTQSNNFYPLLSTLPSTQCNKLYPLPSTPLSTVNCVWWVVYVFSVLAIKIFLLTLSHDIFEKSAIITASTHPCTQRFCFHWPATSMRSSRRRLELRDWFQPCAHKDHCTLACALHACAVAQKITKPVF